MFGMEEMMYISKKNYGDSLKSARQAGETAGFENGYKEGYRLGKQELPHSIVCNINCLLEIVKKLCTVEVGQYEDLRVLPYREGYSLYKSNITIPKSIIRIKTNPMEYIIDSDEVLINDIKDILNGEVDKFLNYTTQ